MTTIGELTLNDIGKTRFRIEQNGSTVEGLLTNLEIDVDITEVRMLQGSQLLNPGTILVHATPTLGTITLDGLGRDHPCEVIR